MASSVPRPEDAFAKLLRDMKDEIKALQRAGADMRRRLTALEAAEAEE